MQHRIEGAGRFEHADERGGLQHIQLLGRRVEIGARRHLDAERVEQERHRVEVRLEDLALRVDRLDLHGRDRLLDLPREVDCAPDFLGIEIAGQLLGNGRAALQVARESSERRCRGAPEIDSVMAVESVVFRRDQRVDDMP